MFHFPITHNSLGVTSTHKQIFIFSNTICKIHIYKHGSSTINCQSDILARHSWIQEVYMLAYMLLTDALSLRKDLAMFCCQREVFSVWLPGQEMKIFRWCLWRFSKCYHQKVVGPDNDHIDDDDSEYNDNSTKCCHQQCGFGECLL